MKAIVSMQYVRMQIIICTVCLVSFLGEIFQELLEVDFAEKTFTNLW